MSGDTIVLDPRVEELLREVASQPGSALLRMPRAKVMRTLAAHQRDFGPMTVGLSLAERELVRAHRGELAFVLRQACVVALLDERKRGAVLARTTAAIKSADEVSLRERMTSLSGEEELAGDEACGEALTLLTRCVSGSVADYSVSQLAAASHRLAPSNLARHHAAMEALEARTPKTALALFNDCLVRYPDEPMRIAALEGMAAARALEGRYEEALAALLTASALGDPRFQTYLGCVGFSLQLGDAARVRAFGSRLEEHAKHAADSLERVVDQLRLLRSRGAWQPTQGATRLANILRDEVPPAARKVIDAFQ